MNKISFAFFGTSLFSTIVLDELIAKGIAPNLIITAPDKPAGRKLVLTPPPVKVWAEKHAIPFIQPAKIKDPTFFEDLKNRASGGAWDVFVVASYGKIIPQAILDLPKHGALNIHPSLLPKLRGPSPLQTSILEDMTHTGVTLMQMDAEMDHGPIIAQNEMDVLPWPATTEELKQKLGTAGAHLLAENLKPWTLGKIKAAPQNHSEATFTKMIEKADGLIDLAGDPYKNFLKIKAFSKWPTAYFFVERNGKKIRVIIKKAEYKDGKLEILRVIPEGKQEMNYRDFPGAKS